MPELYGVEYNEPRIVGDYERDLRTHALENYEELIDIYYNAARLYSEKNYDNFAIRSDLDLDIPREYGARTANDYHYIYTFDIKHVLRHIDPSVARAILDKKISDAQEYYDVILTTKRSI